MISQRERIARRPAAAARSSAIRTEGCRVRFAGLGACAEHPDALYVLVQRAMELDGALPTARAQLQQLQVRSRVEAALYASRRMKADP